MSSGVPAGPAQEHQDGRVQVAGAGAHHQALQRGEAHGRVHGLAAPDGRDGGAVPQVGDDAVELLHRKVQQRRGPVRHVLVRGAVEAVAADAVVGVELVRDGVAPGVLGQGAVEGGVEHGDLRHVRPLLGDGADAQHVGGVVQRGQRVEPLDGAGDLVVDQDRLGEALAAVHHAVADGVELPVAELRVDGRVHLFQRLGMVARALDLAVALAAVAHADLLDQPLGEHTAGRDIADLVLERGRAGVDDEHEHGAS